MTFLDDEEEEENVDDESDSGQGTENDWDQVTRDRKYVQYIPLEVDSKEQGEELNEMGEEEADGDSTASEGGGGMSTLERRKMQKR